MFALILLIGFSSCEKVIDFDIPEADPKLVLNSYLGTTDSLEAFVGSSLSYLNGGEPEFLSNADVKVYQNDVLLGDLNLGYSDLGQYKLSEILEDPGEYELVASAPGFDGVSAKTIVPQPAEGVALEFVEEVDDEHKFRLNFTDVADQEDYYHMMVTQTFEEIITVYSPIEFSTNSEVFLNDSENFSLDGENYFYTRALFSDAFFDGENVSIEFKVSLISEGVEYNVQLIKCSEDYFLYHKSLYAAENAGDLFTQPVQVYTNVDNGLGCVAGYNMTLIPLEY